MSKYYDLYSIDGYFSYLGDWALDLIWNLLQPFTILPVPIWIAMFENDSWEGFWIFPAFYPNWFGVMHILAWILDIRMPEGFAIM